MYKKTIIIHSPYLEEESIKQYLKEGWKIIKEEIKIIYGSKGKMATKFTTLEK